VDKVDDVESRTMLSNRRVVVVVKVVVVVVVVVVVIGNRNKNHRENRHGQNHSFYMENWHGHNPCVFNRDNQQVNNNKIRVILILN
jgi:hypothetical protein